jgi:hypothetical protein
MEGRDGIIKTQLCFGIWEGKEGNKTKLTG